MRQRIGRGPCRLRCELTSALGWSLWSKDIIFLFPPDSKTGTQAWVDAYHDSHPQAWVSSLPIKAGALQGAIAIDYPQESRFKAVHIVYDGVNGQLPNLDLINSIVHIAGGQMGFSAAIQGMWKHTDSYRDRLQTMAKGMVNQGLGCATGPHSSFIPYHVDAVTLQPFGEGWQDEMAMGRLVEGSFRSLNNLLEHLHQSFFFYLLMNKDRFVSIGTYLPSAMLLAANFTIMAIYLWVQSGQAFRIHSRSDHPAPSNKPARPKPLSSVVSERELFLPIGLVLGCHCFGIVPLYIFNNASASVGSPANSYPRKATSCRARSSAKTDHHVVAGSFTDCVRHLNFHPPPYPFLVYLSLFQPNPAALSSCQMHIPASLGHVLVVIGNIEFLTGILCWTFSKPHVLYSAFLPRESVSINSRLSDEPNLAHNRALRDCLRLWRRCQVDAA